MGKLKTVEQVMAPAETHWVGDGFRVHNFFPFALPEDRMSPFYLLDYNSPHEFPPTLKPRGVGPHPHRGFETVTISFQGKVAHHDSRGNAGVIGEGDLQWMTAGSGILHKEYHEEGFARAGGIFHMAQLWVNLPAKDKMTTPKYQAIEDAQIPRVAVANGTVEVIAGEYNGATGPASTFSPVEMYRIKLSDGGKADISLPAGFNTGMLIAAGSVMINGSDEAATDSFVVFNNDGSEISIEANDDALCLLLSGEPLNEPIASYGPFVMNSQDEIRQAMRDFGSGQFGELE